ncbi:nucleoside-diphosphate kinase [Candidatus Saccharibacteria bacterium]|nr:nucleoside-diphosphate kinase [Candidatus Saccharibacteria bacterium]
MDAIEQTLVVLKPDAVQRGIMGDIISRFEKRGLKIIGSKMLIPDDDLLNRHYPGDRDELVVGIGNRTLEGYKDLGIDVKGKFGHDDPVKIGHEVRGWLVDFMKSGPVFAMVIEGPNAIQVVRKIRGNTEPLRAELGTITGDHSFDSSAFANAQGRPIKNLVHASGNKEEADFEVALWFSPEELFEYETINQKNMI